MTNIFCLVISVLRVDFIMRFMESTFKFDTLVCANSCSIHRRFFGHRRRISGIDQGPTRTGRIKSKRQAEE